MIGAVSRPGNDGLKSFPYDNNQGEYFMRSFFIAFLSLLMGCFLMAASIEASALNAYRFGIVCAISAEADPIIQHIDHLQTIYQNHVKYFVGDIKSTPVVLTISGVGIANAAISTALLIERFQPDYLVFSGSAARIDEKLHIGDVVLSRAVYALDYGNPGSVTPDISLPMPNPIRGVKDPLYFYASKQLLEPYQKLDAPGLLKDAHDATGKVLPAKIVIGLLATSEHFPNDDRDASRMAQNHVEAVSMEGSGFMKACWIFQKDCIVIRGISNVVGLSVKNPSLAWNKDNEALAEWNAGQVTTRLIESFH